MIVEWTDEAIDRLVAIHGYLSQFDPAAANRVAQEIEDAAARLRYFPLRGKSRTDGTRELVVPGRRYIIRYQVADDAVTIMAIWHGAQNRD